MKQMGRDDQATLDETQGWAEGVATVATLIGKQFPRAEPRQRATAY